MGLSKPAGRYAAQTAAGFSPVPGAIDSNRHVMKNVVEDRPLPLSSR